MSKIANEILLQLERKYPNHTLLNNQPILRFLLEKSIEDVLDNGMLINNTDQAISATVDDSDVEIHKKYISEVKNQYLGQKNKNNITVYKIRYCRCNKYTVKLFTLPWCIVNNEAV